MQDVQDTPENKADYWANIHEDGSIVTWPTKEIAEKHITRATVACIRIESEARQENDLLS